MYIKESTYANYSNNVFTHIIPSLGNYYLDELNYKIIQNYILELYEKGNTKTKKGLAEKTIKDIVNIIKGSLKEAINEEKMKHFELSFKYLKRNEHKEIYVLTKREQDKILAFL